MTVFLKLLGSTCVKAVCRTLMKLSPYIGEIDPQSTTKAPKMRAFKMGASNVEKQEQSTMTSRIMIESTTTPNLVLLTTQTSISVPEIVNYKFVSTRIGLFIQNKSFFITLTAFLTTGRLPVVKKALIRMLKLSCFHVSVGRKCSKSCHFENFIVSFFGLFL